MSRWTLERSALRGRLRGLRGRARAAPVLWVGPHGVVAVASMKGAAAAPASTPPVHADFAAWCAAHPGKACRVLLSSEWLAVITTNPALGLRHADELQAHARTQFEQYHGSEAHDWPLRLWQHAAGSGATALRGGVLARLQAAAAAHGVRLLSVQPAWTAVVAALAPTTPALLLLAEGNLVTAIATARGQAQRVALRRCPDAPGLRATWLADLRAEWSLDGDRPMVWVQGPPDSAGSPAMTALPAWQLATDSDFLTSAQPSRLPLLAAAAALCVALAAALDTQAAWDAAQTAQQALDTAQQTPARANTNADATGSAAAVSSEAEARLLTALRQPWPAVFAAAEAATRTPTQGLLFDHDGRTLRLEATAPDGPAAWQAAATLGRQPGVSQASVAHLQADGPVVRFELRADWAAAASPTPSTSRPEPAR